MHPYRGTGEPEDEEHLFWTCLAWAVVREPLLPSLIGPVEEVPWLPGGSDGAASKSKAVLPAAGTSVQRRDCKSSIPAYRGSADDVLRGIAHAYGMRTSEGVPFQQTGYDPENVPIWGAVWPQTETNKACIHRGRHSAVEVEVGAGVVLFANNTRSDCHKAGLVNLHLL